MERGQLFMDGGRVDAAGAGGAEIPTLTTHRLGRGEGDLLHRVALPVGDNELEEESSALCVGMNKGGEIGHVVLVGSQVKDVVHTPERPAQIILVHHVALDELSLFRHVGGLASRVYPGLQVVQDADTIALFQQQINRMGADETSPAGHKHFW